MPPTWVDPVQFRSGHVAKCLDVILERLLRLVGQLRECFERNLTGDFQTDQSLNLFPCFGDAERDTSIGG